MTIPDQVFPSDAPAAAEPAVALSNRIALIGLRLVTWAKTCADHYSAAATYEHLSGLSDVELTRRGLSRATLARDVAAACDRHAKA